MPPNSADLNQIASAKLMMLKRWSF